jgi:hypothetical protein
MQKAPFEMWQDEKYVRNCARLRNSKLDSQGPPVIIIVRDAARVAFESQSSDAESQFLNGGPATQKRDAVPCPPQRIAQ